MPHCSRTLPSPQHSYQLIPFPKKATNIYGRTFLAFQTQWVPCASLQQCKASLWGTTTQHGLEVAMKKIRFRSLWIKTHCVGRPFFLGSSVALPTLLQDCFCPFLQMPEGEVDWIPHFQTQRVKGVWLQAENTSRRQNVLMAIAGLVFFTIKYPRTNLAAEKWQTDCRIHLLLEGTLLLSCLLLIGVWVGRVPAFLCQLCCQHAPGVPPGSPRTSSTRLPRLCTLTHTGQAHTRYLGAQRGEGNLPG